VMAELQLAATRGRELRCGTCQASRVRRGRTRHP